MVKSSRKRGKKASSKKSVRKKGRTTTKRTSIKKRGTTRVKYESTKEIKVEQALTDNFIALQKVMVNLSTKFDNLAGQISKLLELFEISAKSLAQKDVEAGKTDRAVRNLSDKLDHIAEKAGLIGRGLALMHEVHVDNPEEKHPVTKRPLPQSPRPRALQQRQMPNPGMAKPRATPNMPQRQGIPPQGYQRSISSNMPKE